VNGAVKQPIYRALSSLHEAILRLPEKGLRVLMYHSVGFSLEQDPYGNSIDVETFRTHAEALHAGRDTWMLRAFEPPRPGERAVCVSFDDGYRDVLSTAAPALVDRKIPFILFATSGLIRSENALYLRPAQLRELASLPGAQIGSHGATHRRLTTLPDRELEEELVSSRAALEDMTGRPVNSISYPHGDVDRRVRDAAARAGYHLGGTSRYGLNSESRDPLLLCRTEVTAWDSAEDLRAKIRGAWDWYALRRPDPQDRPRPSGPR